MNSKVRRVETPLAQIEDASIETAEDASPVTRERDGLSVSSQKIQDVVPRIILQWRMDSRRWNSGCQLLGFRSSTEFATSERPKNLSDHGQMFLEETADGTLEERLPEGTYFYTFVVRRPLLGGMFQLLSNPIRFSETIASAKIGIGRIEDQRKLQNLMEEGTLHGVKSQIARNEADIALHRSKEKLAAVTTPKPDDTMEAQVRREVEKNIREKLKDAMIHVEMLATRQEVERQLKESPAWKKLSKEKRKKILDDVVDGLDPEEETFDEDK